VGTNQAYYGNKESSEEEEEEQTELRKTEQLHTLHFQKV
jgi:hypothetical protein